MTERPDVPRQDEPEFDADRLLGEWMREEAPSHEPPLLTPNVIARTALVRPRPRWRVGDWWRGLFRRREGKALIGALAAGVTAALLLLVVLATPALERGDTSDVVIPADALVVSADDGSLHATIADAISEAEPGDTVAIMAGEYVENLVIDKDITLLGAGEPADIVLRSATPDEPIIRIDDGEATLTGFTLTGPSTGVLATASTVALDGMILRDVGRAPHAFTGAGWETSEEGRPSVIVELLAEADIRKSRFEGGGPIEVSRSSTALIEANELVGGPHILLRDASGETVVRGNTITDPGLYAIESVSSTELRIEGNTISQRDPGTAILAVGHRGTIADNSIDGANVGILVTERAQTTITDNRIRAEGVALEIHPHIEVTTSGNELCGGNAIIALVGAEAVTPDVSADTLCEGVPVVFGR